MDDMEEINPEELLKEIQENEIEIQDEEYKKEE